MYNNRHDCDIFFAQMKDNTSNSVRLGDPFFSAFLPVFNVTSEMVGLALSARALDGVAVVNATVDPEPTTLLESPFTTEYFDNFMEEMTQ